MVPATWHGRDARGPRARAQKSPPELDGDEGKGKHARERERKDGCEARRGRDDGREQRLHALQMNEHVDDAHEAQHAQEGDASRAPATRCVDQERHLEPCAQHDATVEHVARR